MAVVSDDAVLARLMDLEIPVENFFVMPGETETEGSITFWHPEIGARFLIIENEDMAKATYSFLLRRRARRFADGNDIWQAAYAEKWPGWDTPNTLQARASAA